MKYFSHPESDCLFTQPDSEPFPEDPLVCELTIQQYAEAGGKLPDVELDIETYSEEDLKRAGVYRYAAHPSTELLCVCYAFKGEDVVTLWVPMHPDEMTEELYQMTAARLPKTDRIIVDRRPPDDLRKHIEAGGKVRAHNANFERVVLNGVAGKKVDFPHLKIEQMVCTAAKMRVHGLPGALEDAASALGTHPKDSTGKGAMLQLCKPRTGEVKRYSIDEYPEKYAHLFSYCVDDVRAERGVDDAVPDLTAKEQAIYELDQRANDRGILLDTKFIADVQFLIDEYKTHLEALCREWTGFKPTQRGKIAEWVRTNGYPQLVDMTADTVRKTVKDAACPEPVKNVLKLYSTYGMKAVSKYPRMLEAMGEDERIRGMFLHYGAGTGRWSSRIVQLQNLYRPVIKDTDNAIEAIATRDLDWIRTLYTVDPMKVFASCVRGSLIASPGREILAIDYSGIESRLTAWVFNERWKLAAFRAQDDKTGPDTYKLAYSKLFQIPVDAVRDSQRQIGKVLELSMGFEGGVMAFVTMAATYNIDLNELTEAVWPILPPELIDDARWSWDWARQRGATGGLPERTYLVCECLKRLWRAAHPAHRQGWKDMKTAAIQAVLNPGTAYAISTKKIMFKKVDQWLYMRLPSGRRIAYFRPEVVQPKPIKTPEGGTKIPDPVLYYWGVDTDSRRWMRVATYGGRLCLAEDTRVLTDSGWKRIQDCTATDMLWDGVEWVSHGGLLAQGVQPVMEYAGVQMTEDHEVLTDEGWRTAIVAQSEGLARADVRLPDDHGLREVGGRENLLARTLRVWKDISRSGQRHDAQTRAEPEIVRVYDERAYGEGSFDTRHVHSSRVSRMAEHEGSMPAADASRVAQLWRKRDLGLRAVGVVRELLGRYGSGLRGESVARSYRQRGQLREGQLPLEYAARASEQYAPERLAGDSSGQTDLGRGGEAVRNSKRHAGVSFGARLAVSRGFANTFDLCNAGPRRRFTVHGSSGELLIVHNCQNFAEGIARDLLVNGLQNLEGAGYPVLGSVHDEGLFEPEEGHGSFEEAKKLFLAAPEWAAGLPLNAAGFRAKRYRK